VVDIELTGLDVETDEFISIAVVPFEYDERGVILHALPNEAYGGLPHDRPDPLRYISQPNTSLGRARPETV
jgi:hypothetical protein